MTNKITNSLLVLAVGGLIAVGSASAQTTTNTQPAPATPQANTQGLGAGGGAGKYDPNHPRVNQINNREQMQQESIAKGLKNGTLSPKQAENLERGEQHLQHEEKQDMRADGGHLTKQDQRQLNRQANQMRGKIYRDKH
jgi:hypothetical protein